MNLEHRNIMVPELTVSNFSESLSFYTQQLGFTVLYSRTEPNFAYLAYENMVQFMIEEFQKDGWNTDLLEKPFGRGINFQLRVSSIEAILNRLQASSYPLFEELYEAAYQVNDQSITQLQFLVKDPDEYLLRFTQIIES